MKLYILLGFAVIALILVPNVSALTSQSCEDGNIRTNITQLNPRVEYVWEEPCDNGCVQYWGGTYVCATTSFFIPMELYIIFQIVAFAFFFIMLFMHYGVQKGNPFPFAILAMVMFGALGLASFNMQGIEFLMGAALNWGLFMFSFAFTVLSGLDMIPEKV